MTGLKTLKDINLSGKNVILRVDFNCPIKNQKVLNTFRMDMTIETFRYLLDKKAGKIIVLTHLGRPQGRPAAEFSLKPIVEIFKKRMAGLGSGKEEVKLIDYNKDIRRCVKQAQAIKQGVVFLENIRFWEEEEQGDEKFSQELAGLGELYVNDAFSVCHRSHSSVTGIAKVIPARAGLLLEEELKKITEAVENPKRPAAAIVGGAKLETKIPILEHLAKKYDKVLVGGLIAVELCREKAREVLEKLPRDKVILPGGYVDSGRHDIDEESAQRFSRELEGAGTILWNGPMGMFEKEPFDQGSRIVGQAVVGSGAYTLAGGGETIEMLETFGLLEKMDFVSTGGGAMLEYIGGKKLPGIEILKK
ncbi:MAG: phosphoglycerate kinase [Patescibacteria group bacterium]|nr:phosphoglycerate kinase [Patescibacteria group bacterium]